MAPFFITCADCNGARLLDGEPCVYCDSKGYREEWQETEAALKERVRLCERLLFEPGFEMAFLFLLGRQGERHLAEIAAITETHPAPHPTVAEASHGAADYPCDSAAGRREPSPASSTSEPNAVDRCEHGLRGALFHLPAADERAA